MADGRRLRGYFHGGVPGLKPGDRILPPDVTGTDRTTSRYMHDTAPHTQRRDVVYYTREPVIAATLAALYPDGALYRVCPHSPIVPDPDDDACWHSPAATVLDVVEPLIRFEDQVGLVAEIRLARAMFGDSPAPEELAAVFDISVALVRKGAAILRERGVPVAGLPRAR